MQANVMRLKVKNVRLLCYRAIKNKLLVYEVGGGIVTNYNGVGKMIGNNQ